MMYRYRFIVKGAFPFPCDMLRYDACFPADSIAAATIEQSIREPGLPPTTVELEGFVSSKRGPTIGRWESFGWSVVPGSVQTERV